MSGRISKREERGREEDETHTHTLPTHKPMMADGPQHLPDRTSHVHACLCVSVCVCVRTRRCVCLRLFQTHLFLSHLCTVRSQCV